MFLVVLCLLFLSGAAVAADYHVDSDGGNDSSSGISPDRAWATLARASQGSYGPGDRILLQRGDQFSGKLLLYGVSGVDGNPVVLGAYGEGERPFIDASGYLAGVHVRNSHYVEVGDLEITADGGDTVDGSPRNERYGVLVDATEGRSVGNVAIRNVAIHDVYPEISTEHEGRNSSTYLGIGIRLLGAVDNVSSDFLVEDCDIQRVAYKAIEMRRVSEVDILGNYMKRIGGPAMQASLVEDLLVRGNTVDGSGDFSDPRMHGRGSGIWPWGSRRVLIEKNRFMHARGRADSCGVHIDFNCSDVVVQYNLSLDNEGGFVEILGNNHNCAYRYNISINDGARLKGVDGANADGHVLWTSGYVGRNNKPHGPYNCYIYNNTVYVSKSQRSGIAFHNKTSGLLIANNIFFFEGEVADLTPAPWTQGNAARVVWKNNLYQKADLLPGNLPVSDSAPLIGDPGFAKEGGWEPEDYRPYRFENVKDKGIAIERIPGDAIGLRMGLEVGEDFFGNPIVDMPDLGAIEIGANPLPMEGGSAREVPASDWRAQWIWIPETDEEKTDTLLARKRFSLSERPDQALLSVTSSSLYQLYVNGSYAGSGPARSAPHHQSYDRRDVASLLQEGENVIAIRAHHQREGVSYYGSSRAGILAQLDFSPSDAALRIQTDDSWRVAVDTSWKNESPRLARFHLEVADRVDLRRAIPGWFETAFDDSDWGEAQVLTRAEGWPTPQKNQRAHHLTLPWSKLVPRDIPYLRESVSKPDMLYSIGTIPSLTGKAALSPSNWVDAPSFESIRVFENNGSPIGNASAYATAPLVMSANPSGGGQALVYDMGEVRNGRPFLEIEAQEGTVVDILCAPYLLEGKLQNPIVASNYVDRIVLSGKRERWEALYFKPTRWLAVVFRSLPAGATIFDAGVIEARYPFEEKGSFSAPDFPELEALWEASAKTVRVCVTDAYTDNYRERRQYAQTAYYAGLGNHPVFGDHALQRRYLKQIAEEQLADGLMPAYAPRHGDDFMVILDSNCFWIRGLHQYLMYSGDRLSVRSLLPAARKLLELLNSYTDENCLIDDPPQPYWLDHSMIDRRGANFCINAHYLGALEDFAQTLEWLGEPGVNAYRSRAQRIRQSLQLLWDPEKQLFADALIDGKRSKQFSEHSNGLALALGIADSEQRAALAERLLRREENNFVTRDSGLVMVTPAMSYFLHAGLCEAGRMDGSLELAWSRFKHMFGSDTNGTLWEEWWLAGTGRTGQYRPFPSGRSDAQTESAFFPGFFARYVLGIEPTQPGLAEVVLRYRPSERLKWRSGAVPTPSGRLEVAWEIEDEFLSISGNAPKGVMVKLDLTSLGSPEADRIRLNGQPVISDQLRSGFLVMPAGKWSVSIEY